MVVVMLVVVVVNARLASLYFISCIIHNDHSQLPTTETHFSSHRTKFTINVGEGKCMAKTVHTMKLYGAVDG